MEESKTCIRCKEVKPISSFGKRHKKGVTKIGSACSSCLNKSNLVSREKNRDHYNRKARERRNARKQRAIAYKGGHCAACGGVFHTAAFDFHHLDPKEKDVDPGLLMGASDEILFKELDKCILLCSNCHRELHYEETNSS